MNDIKDLDIDGVRGTTVKDSLREDSDEDTYAVRDLKTAIRKRGLWKFLIQLGIPENDESKKYIYYYLYYSRHTIGNQYVFMCREKMQPAKWYYKVGEDLPERIGFVPKCPLESLYTKESIGIMRLRELQRRYTIRGVEDLYGVAVDRQKNIVYRRVHPKTGKAVFKIFPSAADIISLRSVIHPDLWYIFPEELAEGQQK